MQTDTRKPIFQFHVSSYFVSENRDYGRNNPVCVIRLKDSAQADIYKVLIVRNIQWSGGSKMIHDQTHPLPGTGELVVAWIETDGDIKVRLDDNDLRRTRFNLGNEPFLALTKELFDTLKQSHAPTRGC